MGYLITAGHVYDFDFTKVETVGHGMVEVAKESHGFDFIILPDVPGVHFVSDEQLNRMLEYAEAYIEEFAKTFQQHSPATKTITLRGKPFPLDMQSPFINHILMAVRYYDALREGIGTKAAYYVNLPLLNALEGAMIEQLHQGAVLDTRALSESEKAMAGKLAALGLADERGGILRRSDVLTEAYGKWFFKNYRAL